MNKLPEPDFFDELFAGVVVAQKTAHKPAGEQTLDDLIAEALRPRPQWHTTHAVILLHKQTCDTCGSEHVYCDGWYARQRHSTDKHATRLLRGKPVGKFPHAKEIHQSSCHVCASCADTQIAMQEGQS